MRTLHWYTFLFACCISVSAQALQPTEVHFCYDNEDIFPWTFKDRKGLSPTQVEMALKSLNITLKAEAMPQTRCLAEMQAGNVDGAIGCSFKTERWVFGDYPMGADGKADPAFRMYNGGYSLYRLKGSNLGWDAGAQKFLNLKDGKIGVQPGYSVIDLIKAGGATVDAGGATVDDGARTALDNFNKLLAGRVAGIAVQTSEGDNILKNTPDFSKKMEAVDPPLVQKPYYLMIAKQLETKYPGLNKQIWEAISKTRESDEFKAAVSAFK